VVISANPFFRRAQSRPDQGNASQGLCQRYVTEIYRLFTLSPAAIAHFLGAATIKIVHCNVNHPAMHNVFADCRRNARPNEERDSPFKQYLL
jgi:hypothetical protein